MNDQQQLLASAYLDGALTDDERALAEADPEVMAAVESLGELRRALAVVDPPDRARRDAAINAALGVFDSESRVATPPPVTSLSARRWSRWLMPAAAAAVVVTLAGGILATQNDDGGGDDSASIASTDEGGVLLSAQEEDQSAADTAPAATAETRSADQGGAAAATTNAASAEAPGTLAAAGTAVPEHTDTASFSVLTSPEQLTEFASRELLRAADDPASAVRQTCDEVRGRWLGSATLIVDGVETPVEVFLAAPAGEVRAVETATCTVVARAPAPER